MAGFRVRNQIQSWWARRWLEALHHHGSRSSVHKLGASWREQTGHTLARRGSVLAPTIEGTTARAWVADRRDEGGVRCWIRIRPIDDATWSNVTGALASHAQTEATLLAGEMPLQIDMAFTQARARLWPVREGDLTLACDRSFCPQPCEHVAALHYVLADWIERDPFFLFELRGRPRARLLGELQAARRGGYPSQASAGVALETILGPGYDVRRGELPAPPVLPALTTRLLDALDKPEGWTEPEAPARLLGALVSGASVLATEARRPVRSASARRASTSRSLQDERVQRVHQLGIEHPKLVSLVPAVATAALAQRAAQGDDAEALLTAFDAWLREPAEDLEAWFDAWTSARLAPAADAVLALDTVQMGGDLVTMLWHLGGTTPLPLRWWREQRLPANEQRKRGRTLAAVNELVPIDQNVTLVSNLDGCGPDTAMYLEALGWQWILRCPPGEPVALAGQRRTAQAWLPQGEAAFEACGVSLPRREVRSARLVIASEDASVWCGVTDRKDLSLEALLKLRAPQGNALQALGIHPPVSKRPLASSKLAQWIWMQVLAAAFVDLLGSVLGDTNDGRREHMLERFDALATVAEGDAIAWLTEVASRFHPPLASPFWGQEEG